MKHILDSQSFDRAELAALFDAADRLMAEPASPLKGKVMATMFYEPSTRTRLSFEAAMLRLGGEVISTENASEFSSAAKGETIEDTTRVISRYADVLVIRHPVEGTVAKAVSVATIPVINAGDGGGGQHPTQSLLDLYTIHREIGRLDNLKVAMVGDLKYGRTIRSLAPMLSKYKNNTIHFVSPVGLRADDNLKKYLNKKRVKYTETENLAAVVPKVDVLYQTRIQRERFSSNDEYLKYKGVYVIDRAMANSMKKGAIIMHPLPRVDEILPEVDSSPHAKYFEQAGYGLYVRMALLESLLS
ncbi:aspartate carbamoyltransferase [Candidatus Saccharibacteria bacterium]|nr:aspartate carbamoyltransferase [Candidatus Saccharibacteria bacterium]